MNFPGVAVGNELRNSQLYFHHETPSLTMFTPQGLDYISPAGAYISNVEGDFSNDETVTLVVSNRRGIPIAFKVPADDWIGYALDVKTAKVFRVEMLNKDLNPMVDDEPAFVRLVNSSEGSSILLDFSTGEAIEETDSLGRVTRFDEINIIREDGVIAQIDSPGGLIDFEVIDPDFEYEIRLYPKGKYTFNETSGAYELNEEVDPILEASKRFNIKNPAYDRQDIDEVRITRYWDDRITQWQFQYYANNDLWELCTGEIVDDNFTLLQREESRLVKSQDETKRTDIKTVYAADDKLLSKVIEEYELVGGSFELARKVEDPDGANLITKYEYYSIGDARGKLKYQINPNGSWETYSYDSNGRITLKVESWLDVPYDDTLSVSALADMAKSTEYSYTSLDSRDYGISQPDKARTETVRIQGVVTERTWRTYLNEENGYYHEIIERAVSRTAEYGDATNLRSENIYYPRTSWGEPEVRARRLQSSLSEDGTLVTYDYARDETGQFIVVETHVHAEAPEGVAFKSTQHVKTYDILANLIREEHRVFNGSDHGSLYYLTHSYDADRNRLESRRFDGPAEGRLIYTASYSHGKAVSVTDEAGKTVNTTYDILDRKEMEITEGSTLAGVDDIIKNYGYSTSATGCGCTAALVTTQSADGTLVLTEINETDRVERTTRTVDANGLETTYVYSEGSRTITANLPNNATRVTTNYLDGRVKSITGNGVIPKYYTYGVDADGTTWMRVDTVNDQYHEVEDISSVTNLRYLKTTNDMTGRLIAEASPSFNRAGEVSTEYEYDRYSRLITQSQTDMTDRLYEYDALGKIIRSGLDMNGNGQLDLASSDRITDTDRVYQIDEGIWHDVSTTTVYPVINHSAAKTISVSKRQLSGFTGNLVHREINGDIHGNQTIRSTEIDRATKKVTERTDTPFSSIDAERITINGLLVSQNSDTVAAVTTYTYDDLGRLVAVKEPRHANGSEIEYYTGKNQIFSRTDADGNTTAYTYYKNGKIGAGELLSTTNALGQKTYFAYSRLGILMRTWGETDYPQKYTHNKYGELTSMVTWRDAINEHDFTPQVWPDPPDGDKTSWSYDIATGLLRSKRYADGKRTRYIYNAANRLMLRIWARSRDFDTIYRYSKKTGELMAVDYKNADTADIKYTYDRLGRQKKVTDATGIRIFNYDPKTLQLKSETLDSSFYRGYKLKRTYDNQGRSNGYLLEDSASSALSMIGYTYDTYGRLRTVSNQSDSFTYGYKPDSNLLASITAPQHSVSYTYETNRDLMTLLENQVSGTSVSKYEYTYDALSRRKMRTQSGSVINSTSTDTFSYNDRSEVTGSSNSVETVAEWNPTYNYDKIGNRTSSTGLFEANYTSNELNQYSVITAPSAVNSPTYDLDGNLTSDGGSWMYTWNNENRLQSATDGTTTLNFTYDYQGRLVKKDDGTDIEIYLYDGWNRIFAISNPESQIETTKSFLWGLDLSGNFQGAGGVGGLLKEGDLYPAFDANGNIMQKLDSEGTTVMSVNYDPFGNIIEGTLVGDYGFSTKPLIGDLNWYYYGFRYYDPVTGRWLNRDPLGESGGLNVYSFVNNKSTDRYDYLGLYPCCGDQKVDFYLEGCCDGKIYKRGYERCCGGKTIYKKSRFSKECCSNGKVVQKVPRWKDLGYSSAEDCASLRAPDLASGDGFFDQAQYLAENVIPLASVVMDAHRLSSCRDMICPE